MASTSSVTVEQAIIAPAPTFAPDDSDFLDSDAEHDTDAAAAEADREIEQAILSEPHPSEIKKGHAASSTASSSLAPSVPQPAHDLIQVSRRLWFTYFPEPAPSPALLNRKHGRLAAPGNDGARYHWFNVDNDLVYLSFFDDWGPLNVAMFYRFCLHVHHLLTSEDQVERLILYTADTSYSKANTALLAALYAMIIDKVTPADAFHPFSQLEFEPFRDAGYGRPDFYLTIQDILYGMQKAIALNLLDLTTFNLDEYEHFEQVQNGDWNWLTPNFIAFASPNDRDYVAALRRSEGRPLRENYLPKSNSAFANTIRHFKQRGVKLVVRLNNPLYDKVAFEEAGIEHLDLYFDDGSNPSDAILYRFIEKADEVVSAGGVVAVHCKAGLGRTGVLIGGYLIWKHGFTASEVIGFMRLMRPGCVVGPQQHFMYENFVDWVRKGARDAALKEARAALALEREDVLKAGRMPVPLSSRTSLKRPATPDEEVDGADGSRSIDVGSDNGGAGLSDLPVTPRARKDPRLGSSTAAHVKPTPCVGQPRKSPSPSRKRVAPATVARLERNGGGSSSGGGGRPGLSSIGFHQPQFQRVSTRSGTPPASGHAASAGGGGGADENGGRGLAEAAQVLSRHVNGSAVAGSGGGGGGNVLVEAQRLNVQRVEAISSPKAALQTATAVTNSATNTPPVTATVVSSETGTPSPVARLKGHERSRSAVVLGVAHGAAPPSPGSGAGSPRIAVARASPDIKSRYQLKDAGSRADSPSSPDGAGRTDADVLCAEPLLHADGASAAKPAAPVVDGRSAETDRLRRVAAVPSSTKAAPSNEATTRLRPRSKTPGSSQETIGNSSNGVRASSRVASSATNGSSGATEVGAAPHRTRQPSGSVATRPATSIGVRVGSAAPTSTMTAGQRTASGKLRDARAALTSHTADSRLRAGSTRSAQDARRAAKAGEPVAPPRTATTTTTTTGARTASGSRPASRLLAPTAASAARAAATLKRSRVVSPDLRSAGTAEEGGGAAFPPRGTVVRSVSGNSSGSSGGSQSVSGASGAATRIGRSVRRRRSSMGDADVDVVA